MAQRVVDHGDSKKYRTEIPNIVLTLGLTPYELTLYVHLKRTAGADGVCWKSTATLARETGMSGGMVSKAKIGLQKRFPSIKKPLITIAEESNKKGGKPNHAITITDIWLQNVAKFSSSPHEVDTEPSSPHERSSSRGEVASSPHEFTSSPGEIRKELREERTQEEETKKETAHACLLDFHAKRIGKIPDGGAQGSAVKWILENGFSVEQAKGCYEFQLAEEWRKGMVSWLTVKNKIGAWVASQPKPTPVVDRKVKEEALKKLKGWDKLEQRTA